jgi:hypothetical protein
MDDKWLVIQSFQRNQNLVESIGKLLIYYKLYETSVDNRLTEDEIIESKQIIIKFLTDLMHIVPKIEERNLEPLFGVDNRLKQLAKSFVDAKGKQNKFKSALFQKSINEVLPLLSSDQPLSIDELILSLSELRNLLEDQITIDSKDIISNF